MGRGILGTVGLAGTAVLAAPVALFGLDLATSGDTVAGLGFLGVAALMVLVGEHVTTPADVPGMVAERVAGAVVEDTEETDAAGEDEDAA